MQVQRQIDQLLAQRASEWLEVLKHANEAQRAAFVEWLGASRLHVQEFLEVVAVDRELGDIDPQREEDVELLLEQIAPRVTPFPDRDAAAGHTRIKKWKRPVAIAASMILIGVGVAVFYRYATRLEAFTTAVGEQRTIELADASIVHLNADSRIEVQLGETERNIRLMHGEALFKVAQDPQRPFRVHAHAATVQAVGTQFNVYDTAEGTRVAVLEGRVRVTSVRTSTSQMLSAAEEALVQPDGAMRRIPAPDVSRSVAWRQRRLIFDNAPLEDMVREFNRYNRSVRITLSGVTPGSHHYDGIFDADDPGSLAAILSQEKDLTVEMRDAQITVRPRR